MFDLFGSELPLAARFFIAFLVVLALIGLTAWVVRRFGANRLGGAGARGRQPRLAVIDAASVDGRRRLVLIRRDNIEHLLMIGGPTDVVIEPNIVRAASARETAREPARPAMPSEAPVRTAETAWPLQPANEPPTVAPPRSHRASSTDEPWLPPEPGARPRPADSLSGLAAELSTKLTPPEVSVPPLDRSEPRVAPPPAEPAPANSAADHNLSEMAQQLEAALRRAPLPEGRPPVTDPLATQAHAPTPEVKPPAPKVEPHAETKRFSRPEPRKAEPKFEPKPEPKIEPKIEAKPDVKPETRPEPAPAADKNLYDNLEEEMASLLGRPSGKS
jgi:flagellar biogenesis protein FliO